MCIKGEHDWITYKKLPLKLKEKTLVSFLSFYGHQDFLLLWVGKRGRSKTLFGDAIVCPQSF